MKTRSCIANRIPPTRYEFPFCANSPAMIDRKLLSSFFADGEKRFVTFHQLVFPSRCSVQEAMSELCTKYYRTNSLWCMQKRKKAKTDWFFSAVFGWKAKRSVVKSCLRRNHKWHLVRAAMQCTSFPFVSKSFDAKWETFVPSENRPMVNCIIKAHKFFVERSTALLWRS